MRNFFKVIVFCSVLFTGGLSAQTLKFGHIEFQALIQSMPENLTARANVEKVQTSLEAQSTAMQKEAQEKYKEFIALSQAKDANEALVKVKQEEVQSLQERIQNFNQTAQESLQKEQEKQFQPVIEKARKAIGEVAKEQGLIYVFEISGLLYHSDQSIDLLPLVKTKLGIVK